MKRNVKNAICVVLIILSCVMVFLTMNYAKNNVKANDNFSGTPPDMNDDEERKEPG